MKFILGALLVIISIPALAQDNRDLAARVAQVMPLEQQITDFTDAIAQTLPQPKQPLFKSIMAKNIDIPALRGAAEDALLATFSEAELRIMADFYAKPEAAAIMDKLSAFGEAMQPSIQVMVQKAIQDAEKAGVFAE